MFCDCCWGWCSCVCVGVAWCVLQTSKQTNEFDENWRLVLRRSWIWNQFDFSKVSLFMCISMCVYLYMYVCVSCYDVVSFYVDRVNCHQSCARRSALDQTIRRRGSLSCSVWDRRPAIQTWRYQVWTRPFRTASSLASTPVNGARYVRDWLMSIVLIVHCCCLFVVCSRQ